MHFLLVNDDGIGSVGIMALMEAALKRGHRVSMCAPSGQMSAASHRITLSDPLYVKDYPLNRENAQGFAITGTPADCVKAALDAILQGKPDVVLSGINHGYNVGFDIKFLNASLNKCGMNIIDNEVVDLLKIVKKEQMFQENYKLETTLKSYGINEPVPHRALEDAKLAFRLSRKVNVFHNIEKQKC